MYGGLLILAIANYRELTMSKVSGPHGFATIPDLPTLTQACLESSVKLTTWLGVL